MDKARFAVTALVLGCAGSAFSQSFNIDFDVAAGSGGGIPGNVFGAAAGSAGTWNGVAADFGTAPVALVDLSGAATSATIVALAATTNYSFNNAGTAGDDELLMDDLVDAGTPAGTGVTLIIGGLANGFYTVYTYAWAPDNETYLTNVDVTGSTGAQTVGGAWSGFALGVTHAVHEINVTANQIEVIVTTNTGFGSLNGLQLVAVPEPSTLAALGVGVFLIARRRLKK